MGKHAQAARLDAAGGRLIISTRPAPTAAAAADTCNRRYDMRGGDGYIAGTTFRHASADDCLGGEDFIGTPGAFGMKGSGQGDAVYDCRP